MREGVISTFSRSRWARTALLLIVVAAPLAIGLAWGGHFPDEAYGSLNPARNLVTARGLDHNVPSGPGLLRAPLYVLVLWLLGATGAPLPLVAQVLSALGWGVAAAAIWRAGRAAGRPLVAVISAGLVILSPVIVSTLGTEASWVAALAWLALVAALEGMYRAQVVFLILMVWTHFDWTTLVAAALAVAWRPGGRRRAMWLVLLLAAAALGWGLLAGRGIVAPYSRPLGSRAGWGFLQESALHWLYLPLAGLGLLATPRRALVLGPVTALLLASGSLAAPRAVAVTLGLFLVGLGIGRLVEWIGEGERRPYLAAMIVLPLAVAQAGSLAQRYRFRPVARQELERQAAAWLSAHSEATATVLGAPRVAYLADRGAIPWDGGESDQAVLADRVREWVDLSPDYCVSFGSLGWHHVIRTGWFDGSYEAVRTFRSSYDVTSPLVVWRYQDSGFDSGELHAADARLPGSVSLVGFRYWPRRIRGGEAVSVTLFLQATRPITETHQTVVFMSVPQGAGDWMHWRETGSAGERSVPVDWWQEGQIISERFVLQPSPGIPVGAYRVDMSVLASDAETHLPIYLGEDTSALDRVLLGYVVVPWEGDMGGAEFLGADFGDQIALLGFEAPGVVSPGDALDVTLYWSARRPPADDYVVFVHLLDGEGRFAAGHDGPPMEGRYPTRAWSSEEVVPDVHRLVLDPEMAAGTYELRVGMYRWPSLERLPALDGDGFEQGDRSVLLRSIEMR